MEQFDGAHRRHGTIAFDLIGHPKTKQAYGWIYRDGNQNQPIAVLELPPVDSARSTVKVATASKAELDLPTVGQSSDDYTANGSYNKNWSVGFRDNCIW